LVETVKDPAALVIIASGNEVPSAVRQRNWLIRHEGTFSQGMTVHLMEPKKFHTEADERMYIRPTFDRSSTQAAGLERHFVLSTLGSALLEICLIFRPQCTPKRQDTIINI
jgi:hypothetical protein